jgi:hypothetical protein
MRSKYPKYVSRPLCLYIHFPTLYTYPATKIWCVPVQESSRRSRHVASQHAQNTRQFLARTPSLLFDINHTWRRLVNDLQIAYRYTETNRLTLLPCTSTCRPLHRRHTSVRPAQPPGEPRNWCRTAQCVVTVSSSCKTSQQHLHLMLIAGPS